MQAGEQLVRVNQDTRLNYRVLDFRTSASQGIFRIQCQVCNVSSFLFSNLFFVMVKIFTLHLHNSFKFRCCRINKIFIIKCCSNSGIECLRFVENVS